MSAPIVLPRRSLLHAGWASSLAWLTPVATSLAARDEGRHGDGPAESLILLWLSGGPSQLETFDPHEGTEISGETTSVESSVKGIRLASGLARTAERLHRATLVRNLVSKEGDHERGAWMVKTGYVPEATIVHPTIGAIICHELPPGNVEIPRHVSIVPDRFPGRGGYLGSALDAFKTYDPKDKVPDVMPRVDASRFAARLADAAIVEQAFAASRRLGEAGEFVDLTRRARAMMSSEQLQAFDVLQEPAERRAAYGDTPFGRGCLAARRLVGVGVRCVEVTLSGWDTHANNFSGQAEQTAILDPALSALLEDLERDDRLQRTLVVCLGEFGRTPKINRAGGRDHWPHGFSALIAGGRVRRGYVRGATDPAGARVPLDEGTRVADLHATLLSALGIDPAKELQTPIGRPIKLSDGRPLVDLLDRDA